MPKIKTVRRSSSNFSRRSSMVRQPSARLSTRRKSRENEQPESADEEIIPTSQAASGGSDTLPSPTLPPPTAQNRDVFSSFNSEDTDPQLQYPPDLGAFATDMLINGGTIDPSLGELHYQMQTSFESGNAWPMATVSQMTSLASFPSGRTCGEIARSVYGSDIRIDSALGKKISSEVAVREPVQRRPDASLNMERRSNVEAFLAHMTGVPVSRPCKNCHKGHGPWKECIIYDGQLCGSCTNCWFNASGSRCTFHEQPPQLSLCSVASLRRALYWNVSAASTAIAPAWFWLVAAAQLVPSARTFIYPTAITSYSPISPYHYPITSGGSMNEVTALSRRDRFLARIEAAAEELGMRITEYDEYLRTPEGMAEELRAQEKARPASSNESMQEAQSDDSQAR
ncbi:hypothetical protein NM208_g10885 [Fusarium decemcellulare]|uniref:Uncharacterized protein n=1 Tax=Fusarium decemcellulare TaxID=57161 RepID=A0ACC1RWB3_9HYPO|nr:hypothetical protein NM208_g10885 [Fusarium decemcellulare]